MDAGICYLFGVAVGAFVGYRAGRDKAVRLLRRMLIEHGARL